MVEQSALNSTPSRVSRQVLGIGFDQAEAWIFAAAEGHELSADVIRRRNISLFP
jgi:hypothetical protein